MNKNERVFLFITAILMVAVSCFLAFRLLYHKDINVSGPIVPEIQQPEETEEEEEIEKVYINVFFITQNDNKEEVYRAVNRVYDEEIDGSKIKYAVYALISGPKQAEIEKGVYTEIPANTRIISVNETADKVIINLNSAFETGGGTESIYKRIYQLIKTAKKNTTKPVYLYIEGRQADVIGGEGIMINQPLNEHSLDG